MAGGLHHPQPSQGARAFQRKDYNTVRGCPSIMGWSSGPVGKGAPWLDFSASVQHSASVQQLEPGSPWTSTASRHRVVMWAAVRVCTGSATRPVPDGVRLYTANKNHHDSPGETGKKEKAPFFCFFNKVLAFSFTGPLYEFAKAS